MSWGVSFRVDSSGNVDKSSLSWSGTLPEGAFTVSGHEDSATRSVHLAAPTGSATSAMKLPLPAKTGADKKAD